MEKVIFFKVAEYNESFPLTGTQKAPVYLLGTGEFDFYGGKMTFRVPFPEMNTQPMYFKIFHGKSIVVQISGKRRLFYIVLDSIESFVERESETPWKNIIKFSFSFP